MSVTRTALSYSPRPLPLWPPQSSPCLLLCGGHWRRSTMGMTPCMRLLLGPHDFQAPNQPPSSVIALTDLAQPFPLLFLRKLGDYSPSKAWKRSLCSTLKRGGAHRSRGGARGQRADLGAGEMQVRVDSEKKERDQCTLSHDLSSLCPFIPESMERFRERDPQSLRPHSTRRSLLHKDSGFSPLGLSDISLSSLTLISLILQD